MDAAWYDYGCAEDIFQAGRYNYVAFLCQQSVEKMLKAAIMARRGRLYHKGHSLKELLDETGLSPPEDLHTFILRLSPHYLVARYLNAAGGRYWELYNQRMAADFLSETRQVLEWLEQKIASPR